MTTVLAVGVGVAAAAFFVSIVFPSLLISLLKLATTLGTRRLGSLQKVQRRTCRCDGIRKSVLQGWFRAQDEPERSRLDITAKVPKLHAWGLTPC